jgi:hypothetical protein
MRTVIDRAPPDPGFADLIWRTKDAAQRRFKNAPGSLESQAAIDDEIALDRKAQRPCSGDHDRRDRPARSRPGRLTRGR